MLTEISNYFKPNQTVAVALSGGGDSMALLYYMLTESKKFPFNVVAINVEHGIRGENSVRDTEFVKKFCADNGVNLFCYSVDSLTYASENKLSIEQAARKLRYDCFFDALDKGLCDKVATAHHLSDLTESVLINVFRGTGIKGVVGIKDYGDKIIRPFINVKKQDIDNYLKENDIPFVTDETNLLDDYTRNRVRHLVVPEIKKIFPEVEKSVARFAEIAALEDDFMDQVALSAITITNDGAKIRLPLHPAILSRAAIMAMKELGLKKDWEKAHVDMIINLATLNNGAKVNLKNGIMAAKEYDVLTFYRHSDLINEEIPFSVGKFNLGEKAFTIEKVKMPLDLKSGFYADLNKIPKSAVIRFKKDGDLFTKFGGGTKPLGEYFTDLKIPLRARDYIPVIADKNDVLAIVGVAVSQKIKVDKTTFDIIEIKN